MRGSFVSPVQAVARRCLSWRSGGERAIHISASDPAGVNWHEAFIEHLAYVLRPRVYVELGLYRCALFNRMVPYCGRLIGVDTDSEAWKWMRKSTKVEFVNSSTDAFALSMQEMAVPIDMILIDANHAKDAVLKDFWNFFPFVSQHGIILLHDTHPGSVEMAQPGLCCDAYRAIEELSRRGGDFELMTIPVHPGLTLCRKRTTQVSWAEPRR